MQKSDKLFVSALAMGILASAEVNIEGIKGALLQVLWTACCRLIAVVLVKKSELEEKKEK